MNANEFIRKTEIVELCLWDLEFITNEKRKLIKDAIWKDAEDIMEEIKNDHNMKLWDTIYVSVSPDISSNNFDILMGIQALVNSGYKSIYTTNVKVNFWRK